MCHCDDITYITPFFNYNSYTTCSTVVPSQHAQRPLSTEATLSNVAANFWHCYCECIHFSLAKGHLSNVATICWQIGWPYQYVQHTNNCRDSSMLRQSAYTYQYVIVCTSACVYVSKSVSGRHHGPSITSNMEKLPVWRLHTATTKIWLQMLGFRCKYCASENSGKHDTCSYYIKCHGGVMVLYISYRYYGTTHL